MNDIQIFTYEQSEIRTVQLGGQPWFVAADVCRALEIKNPTKTIERLDEDEKANFKLGLQGSDANIVSESGLYSLILGSRKPEAKAFKRWIVHDVLPAIRQTGGYQTRQLTTAEMFRLQADYNLECDRKIAELEERQSAAEEKITAAAAMLAAPAVSREEWQEHTNKAISEIVETYGLNHQTYRHKLYAELEDRTGCDLEARQRNMKRRMRKNGATYKDAEAVTKLTVIARDANLRELFSCIVQQEQAKYICDRLPQ